MSRLRNEQGVVALLTSIFMAILLLIITVSLTRLMAGELRQATDSDQSVKAFYAATAGVEDAIQKINLALQQGIALPDNPPCPFVGSAGPFLDANNSTQWTCQRIITTDQSTTGPLAQDQAAELFIPASANLGGLRISWNQSGTDLALPSPYNGPLNTFPSHAAWVAANYPAALEVTVVRYPTTTFSLNNSTIRQFTTVFTPENSIANPNFNNATTTLSSGNCDPNPAPNAGYNCYLNFTNFAPNMNRVFRIRARYAGTHYRVQAYNCAINYLSNNCAALPLSKKRATIDVTARSGDVYRRVVENAAVQASTAFGLDYAIFSDTNVCKDFSVRDSINAAFGGACNNL